MLSSKPFKLLVPSPMNITRVHGREILDSRGNPTVDGLEMLLHQARPGFELWFGTEPAVTDRLRAAVKSG